MNNLYTIIHDQFPEFVRADYPAFVAFIQEYYKWLDAQGPGKLGQIVDIDTAPDRFVQHFRNQLDVYGLFNSSIAFDRKYLKTIKQVYGTRGSEQALVYILRAAKGAETTIQYPAEQILRASDARWIQEQFITVRTRYGTIPSTIS